MGIVIDFEPPVQAKGRPNNYPLHVWLNTEATFWKRFIEKSKYRPDMLRKTYYLYERITNNLDEVSPILFWSTKPIYGPIVLDLNLRLRTKAVLRDKKSEFQHSNDNGD